MASQEEPATESCPVSQTDVLIAEEEQLGGGHFNPKEIKDDESFYAAMHKRDQPRTALCLSGGGIRSATFSLGVLQGLAKAGVLSRFDFLSTVSGGGFIGSWLSRWIHEVDSDPAVDTSKTTATEIVSDKLAADTPEPDPIQTLRAFSSYLSPKRGLSRDGVTLVAIVLRNLLLTWLVLIPLLLSVLMIPRIVLAGVQSFSLSLVFVKVAVLIFVPLWFIGWHHILTRTVTTKKPWLVGLFPLFLAFILSSYWKPAWQAFVDFRPAIEAGSSAAAYFEYALYTVIAIPVFLLMFVLIYGLIQGLCSRWLSESARERSSRYSAALLFIAGVWLVLSATVLLLPDLVIGVLNKAPVWIAGVGGIAGAAAVLTGFFGQGGTAQPSQLAGSWRGWIQRHTLPIASAAVLLVLAVGLSLATSTVASRWIPAPLTVQLSSPIANTGVVEDLQVITQDESGTFVDVLTPVEQQTGAPEDSAGNEANPAPPTKWVLWLGGLANTHHTVLMASRAHWVFLGTLLLIVLSVLMSWLLGVNRFSLHSLYGNRLIRAYLAAARKKRDPDPETGFDKKDNLAYSCLKRLRPLHIINATLNLSGGKKLAWQKRKGASFTFSALHSGSAPTGFKPSQDYTGAKYRMSTTHGMSLGKAMTISGAAVSPSMGYHSSKLVGAVLTLFNARLGWWLPNPGEAGKGNWHKSEPEFGMWQLLNEFRSRTDETSSFVYVSDGGHFENLGLYEMVRRRCRYIVVVDAGQDVKNEFESLSTALRMIRVDFGIDISFDAKTGPGRGKEMKKHFAIGRIGYKAADDPNNEHGEIKNGVLIYIKPVLLGDEPIDVIHYAETRHKSGARFPQETTADQFFDEAQFESYRKLGLTSVNALREKYPGLSDLKQIPMPEKLTTFASLELKKKQDPGTASKSTGTGKNLSKLAGAFSPEQASAASSMFGQASSWVAPVVASTVAASVAVTITMDVKPPDPIQLQPPETPVVLELPAECDKATGSCGTLGINKLTDLPKLELSSGTKLYLDNHTDPEKGGFVLNRNSEEKIAKATDFDQGIVLNKDSATLLTVSTDDKKGVRINKSDLSELREIAEPTTLRRIASGVDDVNTKLDAANEKQDRTNTRLDAANEKQDSTITKLDAANTKLDDANTKLEIIDGRIDGLRNDSQVNQ